MTHMTHMTTFVQTLSLYGTKQIPRCILLIEEIQLTNLLCVLLYM